MNIAINARFLHHEFGGIGQYLLGIIDAFARSPHPDHLWLYTHLPFENRWQDERIHIKVLPEYTWVPTAGARKSIWELQQFPSALQVDKPSVVFIPYPSLTRTQGIPILHCVHDVIPWVAKEYHKGLLSRMYHTTTQKFLAKEQHLVTVSQFSQQEIARVLQKPVEDIQVIHPGSCFDIIERPTEERSQEIRQKHGLLRPYILYVGGYDKRKGTEQLIASYLEHVAPYQEIDLALVGHPLFRTGLYSDPTANHGAGERGVIRSLGTVATNEELYALYCGAHGFVTFSGYEGFNLPLLQACKAHTPALAFPIPPHEELFKKMFFSLLAGSEKDIWERFLIDDSKRIAIRTRMQQHSGQYQFRHTLGELFSFFAKIKK